MRPRLFIDANIPMYAAGASHPLKLPAVQILEAAAQGQIAATTDAEVFQEIMHRYAALGHRLQGAEVVELFLRIVPDVLPVRWEDIVHALTLYRDCPAIQVRAAVHAAVMQSHGLKFIITADRHFDLLPGVHRIDPTDFERFYRAEY